MLAGSLGSTLAMWDPQAPALAEHLRVVRYDLRGHGRSPVPPGPYSMDDLVDDLVALLDRLEVERAHVVGLSLGGMIAIRMAVREPRRVDRLALMCTSASLGPPQGWADRAAAVRADGTASIAAAVVGRWLTPEQHRAYPTLVAELEAMIASTSVEGYAASCAAIEHMDQRADLATIVAPTLTIAGSDDPVTPPAHLAAIASAIPGARLLVLDGAAHLANLGQPAAVNQALIGHLVTV